MVRPSKAFAIVYFALLFSISCGRQTSEKSPSAIVPEDTDRDFLAEAKAAKISLGRAAQLYAQQATANDAPALNGRFGPQFAWPIIPLHAVLLPNGKVFNFGTNGNGDQGAGFNYDVWSPTLGTANDSHQWLPNQTATDIFCAATTILPDTGDVLVSGGDTRNPVNQGINASSIFSTSAQSLTRTANMQFARWYPTAITLPNGETIIHGGRDGSSNPVATPEIFNNGNWRTLWGATNEEITGNEEGRWFYPRNWVAPNGRVFGMSGDRMYFLDWKGDGGTQMVGRLPNKSRSHISTAVMYQPGKILQVGGSTLGDTQAEGSNQAVTVDITSGTPVVQDAPNMAKRRVWANSTVLPNGEVLITGGSAFENRLVDPAQVAEIWNPDTRQFRQVATAASARLYHSVSLLLPDATVLVAGGGAPGPINNLNGEIFYPPYLFTSNGSFAPRLTIGNMADTFAYNANVNVPYFGVGQVQRVTLVRTGAVTHSFDMGQRFLELAFTQRNGSVAVSMPNTPNIAPPGYYMLFLVNSAGVPSVARIINLSGRVVVQPEPRNPPAPPALTVGEVFSIVSQSSGKCLDVAAQAWENGASIQQYECNKTAAQQFRLIQNPSGGLSLSNLNSGKCIEVAGNSMQSGGLLHQWDCAGGANQTLGFAAQAGGAFQITFAHSSMCLEVPNANPANGIRLQQRDCTAAAAQNWLLVK